MFNLLFISAVLISSTFGHMCLLAPYQRGGYVNDTTLSKTGAAECGLQTGPCGGVSSGFINAAIMSETYSVVMEKNLDHFYAKAPGNFTVALWSTNDTFIRTLGSVPDDNRTSGSIYQVRFPVPHEGQMSTFIIQAVYHTNNPGAPAAFYQCADFEIYPRN